MICYNEMREKMDGGDCRRFVDSSLTNPLGGAIMNLPLDFHLMKKEKSMKKHYEPIAIAVICLTACDVVTASNPGWDLGEPDSD